MKKILGILVLVVIVGSGLWSAYDYYRHGYWTRPDMPPGSFSLIFGNGTRLIVTGVKHESETRKYISRRYNKVPTYYQDAWAFCEPLSAEEVAAVNTRWPPSPGARFEAFCSLKADGEEIPVALLYSVPKL